MSTKQATTLGLIIGSSIGSFVPLLWGEGGLSFGSLFCSAAGALVGIYVGFKLAN